MKEIKNKKYYDNLVRTLLETNRTNRIKLQEGSIKNPNIDLVKLSWFFRDIKILIAKYSRGDSVQELKTAYLSLISGIDEVWKQEQVKLKVGRKNELIDMYILDIHVYMRWLLSLGILFDISDKEFMILVALIKRDKVKDTLYDFLISSRVDTWKISKEMSIQKPVNNIRDIVYIEDKEECEKRIKKYLNKEWYKTHRNCGFYNSHLQPEDMNLFYGFWAFEVAALVKIKELDDSSFRDNDFYPDRLV